MQDKELDAVREFLGCFELVFDSDWAYTKEMLGIFGKTGEQEDTETIHVIAPDATFLRPRVDDEIEDWGNRGALLEQYRRLRTIADPQPKQAP